MVDLKYRNPGLAREPELERRIPGFHCEWNLGSPGGWLYQQMAQELGVLAWKRLRPHLHLPLDLDFHHPYFHPVPKFAGMLLRAHRSRNGAVPPFLVLLAEIETLDSVIENLRFVECLNSLEGVEAALAAPEHLELDQGRVMLSGRPVSLMYMDFNNDTLLKMGRKTDISPVQAAIRQGLVVNPRGMEPVGVKGVFEAITGPYQDLMSESTRRRTPWTRVFYPRRTTGPLGEAIADLPEWTRRNFSHLILKPAQGYSGQGIFVGPLEEPDEAIQQALKKGGYIVQSLVPLDTWQEYYPSAIDADRGIVMAARQTDFRCFITDEGLIGFLGRFGGIPTNVGSGGGTQAFALVFSDLTLEEADQRFNRALEALPYGVFREVEEEVKQRSLELGFTYLLGPIPTSLKPRMLKPEHLGGLSFYARRLWQDAQTLEKLWQQLHLEEVASISPQEKELALLAPWEGRPALMVSDGLYNFRAAGF
ncbi:MAG TPA: hypothetical protein VGA79_08150 [Desulfobaccales bacterium]